MKKYHWLSNEVWQGPVHFQEILKMNLNDDTLIWYPELCDSNIKTPGVYTHERKTLQAVKKALQNKICRYIILSKTPLKGCYRYKNEFQIYPANFENIPTNVYATHFPLALEFRVDVTELHTIPEYLKPLEETLRMSETTNEINKMKKLCSLLTAFTNHRFFNYENTEGSWVIPMEDNIPAEEIERASTWTFPTYYYPGINDNMKISKYSNPTCDQIKVKSDHLKYYMHEPFDNSKGEIYFPHSLTSIFDRYFELKQNVQKIADSSAYLICNGVDLLSKMKSLSFLSFISSIETIVNHEYNDKEIKFFCSDCKTIESSPYHCNTCGRPYWGISRKFRNFLSEYLSPTADSIKTYTRIYGLRSKIVHSGALFLNDSQIDWNQFNGPNAHWMTLRETMQFSRLALVNWILERKQKKEVLNTK